MNIDLVNTYSAKFTIFGWLAGLICFNWVFNSGHHASFGLWIFLAFAGSVATPVLIGAPLAVAAAFVTKAVTGQAEGSADFFAWAALISPVVAFFVARWFLHYIS